MKPKSIVILSEKSSGSSALQNLLQKYVNVKYVKFTQHHQHETLYWTKAASILGMQQVNMLNSEVPLERFEAKNELIDFLRMNIKNYDPPCNDRELIFNGWKMLCKKYSPIFVEKSPHHLLQWSAIKLMLEASYQTKDIDMLFIGLIQNPIDTIYSQYKRWGGDPNLLQFQWQTAYTNLVKLKDRLNEKLVIVKYEDIVNSSDHLLPILSFCGVSINKINPSYLHKESISKWKNDKLFKFTLNKKVKDLAFQFGYSENEIKSDGSFLWPLYKTTYLSYKKIWLQYKKVRRILIKAIK